MGACLGACLAQCGCSCLDKACGSCKSKSGSLIPYMVLFIMSTIVALILRYWGHPLLVNLYIYHLDLCTSDKCLGIGGVNRISFALFVFFFFHSVLLKFAGACSRLDSQSWWTKLLMFIVLVILAWLIPNDFYAVYMHISRVVSGFFLILQLIILIDFGYQWNESWTSDEKISWGGKGVVVVSVLMYLASLTFFILDLVWFGGGGCKLQKFFIAFTFCLTFIMSGISISPWIESGGGLLPAAVVTLYSYWLLFSALTSDPSDCNTVSNHSREFVPLVIGLLLTACSVTYASWSVASNTAIFNDEKAVLNTKAAAAGSGHSDGKDVEEAKEEKDDDEEEEEPADSPASQEKAKLSSRFHLLMACASMYMCMLLSAWGSQAAAESDSQTDLDWANVWIKMVTQWVCIGLYVWTVIAPRVCGDRDFS